MFIVPIFFSFTYFICSFRLKNAIYFSIPHNFFGKFLIKNIRFFRNFYPNFSFKLFFEILDYIKCPFFVVLSAVFFDKKYITDLTAIIAYFAHYFPIWSYFCNDDRNFKGIIFTGFILDPITGVSMLLAYLMSAIGFGYTSIAITSSMIVGIVKTFVHIVFFESTDYLESVFFIFFGALAIYRNRKILMYICEKTVKKDIKYYKFNKKKDLKKENENRTNIDDSIVNKDTTKYKNIIKKSSFYRNYKKFYTKNKKFEEKNREYK